MDQKQFQPLANPVPERGLELRLQGLAPLQAPHALAGSPSVCAELDHYDIAVVLHGVYEWGGYRYTNASDAIAAAKRGRK